MNFAQTRLNKIRRWIKDRIATNKVIIKSDGDDAQETLGITNLALGSVLQQFDTPEEYPYFDDWLNSPWDGQNFVRDVIKKSEIPMAKAAFEAARM